ncbi:MAG: ABC transporter permease [Ktedonobacterales bacterium]|nr:ABC transporter permease [Ktedonobacterales bacterium]
MPSDTEDAVLTKHRGMLQLITSRFVKNRLAVVGMGVLLTMILAAILAPILIGETAQVHPAIDTHITEALQGASFKHLLGTDDVGRDEFARLLYGARVSMLVGFVSMLVALSVGILLGSLAGYFGGIVDTLLMRVTDAFLAVPLYLILFVISAFFVAGGSDSIRQVILILGLFSWANTARITRGEILALREREFITAARAQGVGNARIIARHILPNAAGALLVNATLLVGGNIITESTLSFFGFGIQPPDASWGNMLASSRDYLTSAPLLVYAPGLAILVAVVSFNLMGDGLRDALDPNTTER